MLIVALPLRAENARARAPQEAVGAAGRHPPRRRTPPSCASARAPTRSSAPCRCIDLIDKPIADWDVRRQVAVRQGASPPLALLALAAGDGAGRAGHQARQPRPGAVPPEALRLQQRADRGLQVPLDVRRPGRRQRGQARHQGRPARHPRRPLHPQDQPRRAAAAHQRRSRASCRSSARARTRCRPRPPTGSTTTSSTATSRATGSSPASPAGRRSTAGAARPTRPRRSSSASSTTSTTSRTGRCSSTSTSCCKTPVRAAARRERLLSGRAR